jgi:hypothetical protein
MKVASQTRLGKCRLSQKVEGSKKQVFPFSPNYDEFPYICGVNIPTKMNTLKSYCMSQMQQHLVDMIHATPTLSLKHNQHSTSFS